jgi:hypothetical protein
MEDLCEKINRAIGLLQGFTAEKTRDDDLSDTEIEQLIGELETITAALQFELECRQEACQQAGGHASDKNRAEKVSTGSVADYVENLKI